MTRVERTVLGGAAVVGLGLLGVLYRFDPEQSSFFPLCPSHALLGVYCPGCGATRAIHHLLHLDLPGAFRFNPLLVLALPVLAWWSWATWLHGSKGRPLPASLTSPWAGRVLLGVLVVYTLLRNVPVYPFTLLAPG